MFLTEVMNLLKIVLNPEKVMSTCFLCFKQKSETLNVYQKLFICDKYNSTNTSLIDIMNYLTHSQDMWCDQACEDCFKFLIVAYRRLRRYEYLKETLETIISSLSKEVSDINNCVNFNKLTITLNIQKDEKNLSSNKSCKHDNNVKHINSCKKCDMQFVNKVFLSEHNKMAHQNINKAVICEYCGKDCKKPSTLRVHLNCHKKKACTYCSKILKSHSHYKVHLRNHSVRVRSAKKLLYYSCNLCPYQSLHKNNLEAHTNKVHLQKRPYICDVCHKGFYRKSHLTEHLRVHDQVKNFTCELCGDDFVTMKTLTEHIRLHTGEKPYACEICNARFVSSGRRSDHFKRKHLEKTYCCFLCEKKFGLKKELNAHLKKVHSHSGNSQMHTNSLSEPY